MGSCLWPSTPALFLSIQFSGHGRFSSRSDSNNCEGNQQKADQVWARMGQANGQNDQPGHLFLSYQVQQQSLHWCLALISTCLLTLPNISAHRTMMYIHYTDTTQDMLGSLQALSPGFGRKSPSLRIYRTLPLKFNCSNAHQT